MSSGTKKNTYDKTDIVRLHRMVRAGLLKLAAYTVRDPETGEFSSLQYHMTYDNTVMAVMGESAAKLFADFVTEFGKPEAEQPAEPELPL